MNEDAQEQLALSPLMEILTRFNMTVPMIDDYPTETSLDVAHTVR